MAKHRAGSAARWILPVVGVLGVCGLVLAGVLAVLIDTPSERTDTLAGSLCDRPLRVVTATSFAPVLDGLAPLLDQGDDCVRLDVTTADGRGAIQRVTDVNADVWIPDDTSW